MPVAVPDGHDGLSRQVFHRFRSLVVNGVIDIITATDFDAWRKNFSSEEEQYVAAQLLSAAVIRTIRMTQSSYHHIAQVIVPDLLRREGLWRSSCLEDFAQNLARRHPTISLRFMPVDGRQLDSRPGNSADTIVRGFGQTARIGDGYLCRADDPAVWRNPPRLLILIDDLLGTGTQFNRFARAYKLNQLPATTHCVYVPLLATVDGIAAVKKANPTVDVRPVETLLASAGFFSGLADAPDIWMRDRVNSVADVKAFYRQMMGSRSVPPEGQYSLSLTVLLHGRPPNNSLQAYWSDAGQWCPLLRR